MFVRCCAGRPVLLRTPRAFMPGWSRASARANGTSYWWMNGEHTQKGPSGSGTTRATVIPLMVRSSVSCVRVHEVANHTKRRAETPCASCTSRVPASGRPDGLVMATSASNVPLSSFLSAMTVTPTLQASGMPSASVSVWAGSKTAGQSSQTSPTSSPS